VALRELQYYLVSCIPAQFYLFGARRRRDSYLLGLLRLFLRLFLPKLSAIRVARFNSPRSYDPKKNRCSHERRCERSCDSMIAVAAHNEARDDGKAVPALFGGESSASERVSVDP
jgi:hypothetical protein